MPFSRNREECLQFITIKCKLSSILSGGRASPALDIFLREAERAHQMTKQATAFFKAFCLASEEVPPVSHSTVIACLQQVTIKDPRGKPGREGELVVKMEKFWKDTFSKIYPDKVNAVGKSLIKANVADDILKSILTNATTHFKARCTRMCTILGLDKIRANICVNSAFRGSWNLVDGKVRDALQRVLPTNPAKNSVFYDMKKRPSEYVAATYRIIRETKQDFCFAPTTRKCIPNHFKVDTETCAQMFLPYKEALAARKNATSREEFNDYVWNTILDRRKVDKKRGHGFRFHHEIHTDGVAVSILYSRPAARTKVKKQETHVEQKAQNRPLGRNVGLDPGKRNVATMVDSEGNTLRYTSRQRMFESKVMQFRRVLQREKEKAGVTLLEAHLSQHSHRTNDLQEYLEYLMAKKEYDDSAHSIYIQRKWRNWKLRMFSARKSSQEKFMNRIASSYGEDCHIYYGDWSTSHQMAGCDPTPTVGLRKEIRKKFHVTDVDEYRTSKTCNVCMNELSKYKKRDGRLSYARLCCVNCGRPKDRLKRFVDRDINAASNILLCGMSVERPAALRRTSKREHRENHLQYKRNRPTVDAVGTSNDPTLLSDLVFVPLTDISVSRP